MKVTGKKEICSFEEGKRRNSSPSLNKINEGDAYKTKTGRSKICGEEDKMQPSSNLTPCLVICTTKEPFKQVIRSGMVD